MARLELWLDPDKKLVTAKSFTGDGINCHIWARQPSGYLEPIRRLAYTQTNRATTKLMEQTQADGLAKYKELTT